MRNSDRRVSVRLGRDIGAGKVLKRQTEDNPLDDLLRARLRIPEGSDLRLTLLRWVMEAIDWMNRTATSQPFFALRETEEILIALDGRTGTDLIHALLAMNGGTQIIAHGLENIPRQGAVVIGATHPIGTFDFVAHAGALLERRPDLRVVAGRETERFLGADRIIPVDLDRKDKVLTARQTRAGMIAHLNRGGALLVFGSGRVPLMQDGLLVEPPWRTGVTHTSGSCNAPIVPASADMRNSRHYYRTRKLVAFLSGGNDELGRKIASLRYGSELISKLGGRYEVHYAPLQPPGTAPETLKDLAEGLVPGLYRDKALGQTGDS